MRNFALKKRGERKRKREEKDARLRYELKVFMEFLNRAEVFFSRVREIMRKAKD